MIAIDSQLNMCLCGLLSAMMSVLFVHKMVIQLLILIPDKDVLAKAKTGTGKTVAFLVSYLIFYAFMCDGMLHNGRVLTTI